MDLTKIHLEIGTALKIISDFAVIIFSFKVFSIIYHYKLCFGDHEKLKKLIVCDSLQIFFWWKGRHFSGRMKITLHKWIMRVTCQNGECCQHLVSNTAHLSHFKFACILRKYKSNHKSTFPCLYSLIKTHGVERNSWKLCKPLTASWVCIAVFYFPQTPLVFRCGYINMKNIL